MTRYLLTLIFSGILYSVSSQAQDVVPLSLEDCIKYAIQHNYTARNARLDVLIQQAQNNETIAAALPRLNGKVEFDDNVVPQKTFFPTGSFGALIEQFVNPGGTPTGNTTTTNSADQYTAIQFSPKYAASAALSGSQTLFDGGVLVALQARKTVLELARQNSEVTNETIRYNVLKAYNSLVIAYRQYDIIKHSLHYARSVEHDIVATQKAGFAEKIDVERTAVQVNNLATDSIKVGNLLEVSAELLKFQMGMDINTPIMLTDTSVEERTKEVFALLDEDENYERVPEFSLFNTQLKLNQYNVKRYQYAALPTLNIFANAGYNYASQNFSDFGYGPNYLSNVLVGLQLNVPIFNGFLRDNQVREAKLNVEKSKNNIENIKLTIDFQSAQSRTTLKNALLQAESQKRNLALANDVLDLAQRKYKAGVGSNLETTQAQTDQLQAQNNYFNALLDVINAEADLKKALGLLK